MAIIFRRTAGSLRRSGLAVFTASAFLAAPVWAQPVEPLVIPAILARADLVVVGRVTRKRDLNTKPIFTSNDPMHQAFALRVDSVLKGAPLASSRPLNVLLNGRRGVVPGEYGMFFLGRDANGTYATVDQQYTIVVAAPAVLASDPLTRDPMRAIALELVGVIASPRRMLADPRGGIVGRLWPGQDVVQEENEVYFEAFTGLLSMPPSVQLQPLQNPATNGELINRLWANACLLHKGDSSHLMTVEAALMKPQPDDEDAVSQVGLGLMRIKSAAMIPVLKTLRDSPNTQVREGAFYALREAGVQP